MLLTVDLACLISGFRQERRVKQNNHYKMMEHRRCVTKAGLSAATFCPLHFIIL